MDNSKLIFCKATKSHAPQFKALKNYCQGISREVLTEYAEEDIETVLDTYLHFIALTKDEKTIAAVLRYIDKQKLLEFDENLFKAKNLMSDKQKLFKIAGVVTLPEFQKQGIQQILIGDACQEALNNGRKLGTARIHENNINSQRTFELAGFQHALTAPGSNGLVKRYYNKQLSEQSI